MTADILTLPNADDVLSAYTEACATFRASPSAERMEPVLTAFRRFHRIVWPHFDTEAAVAEVKRRMWAEIAKRQGRGDAA